LSTKRRIVSNLGFFLQVTGLLLILPVAIGLQEGELQSVSSLIATCFLCFGVGFVFNSFAERKELDEKTSLWLLLFTFTLIPLVLMIPYVWNNVFNTANLFELFTNAYFEAVSGFTTTGFTFVADATALPLSLLFYRSMVEFIGGVGFVYVLVAFLFPKDGLDCFCKIFGIDLLGSNLKKLFAAIILVYTFFVAVFTLIFYAIYSQNWVVSACAAIDVLTGGYQPIVAAGIGLFQISILALMFLGSLHFCFHYNLFRFKRGELNPEIKFYLKLLLVSTVAISILAWINPFDALFHVVTMASSTGIDYIGIANTALPAKILFILIGIAGGCTFSLAGGIKMQRIRQLVNALLRNNDKPTRKELKSILFSIFGFATILLVFSLAFSTLGVSLLDSIFEVSSALTTNGISMGATTIAMPLAYKWLLVIAMIIGRVEIVNIFRVIRGLVR
jgi:trk system potassium uptake protein TrkH